jgi:hypothetical protein
MRPATSTLFWNRGHWSDESHSTRQKVQNTGEDNNLIARIHLTPRLAMPPGYGTLGGEGESLT